MRHSDLRWLLALLLSFAMPALLMAASLKPRVLIMSDFPPLDVIPGGAGRGPAEKRSDPDDVQSMVRFLVYANEFDVEGLVASAGTFANIARKQNILDILNLYDQVDENLALASRNLANVLVVEPRYADPLSLVFYKKVLVTKGAIEQLKEMFA